MNEESFLTEKDLVKNKDGEYETEMGEKVKEIEEQNYVYRFEREVLEEIREWTNSHVSPKSIQNKMLDEVSQPRPHLSISRPKSRISWGIDVPSDPSQTVYVWLDALTNYLTVVNFNIDLVPNFIHFVGKDIAKFHCIYWPSFLISAFGVKPGKVVNHGHWLKDGRKMSKSLGNVVEPNELIGKYGIDSIRLYFLGYGPLTKDMDFDEDFLQKIHNNLLIDSYMNMLFRMTGKKILKKFGGSINKPDLCFQDQITKINILALESLSLMSSYDFPEALKRIETIIHLGNHCLSINEFWSLEDPEPILYLTLETMKVVSILL